MVSLPPEDVFGRAWLSLQRNPLGSRCRAGTPKELVSELGFSRPTNCRALGRRRKIGMTLVRSTPLEPHFLNIASNKPFERFQSPVHGERPLIWSLAEAKSWIKPLFQCNDRRIPFQKNKPFPGPLRPCSFRIEAERDPRRRIGVVGVESIGTSLPLRDGSL